MMKLDAYLESHDLLSHVRECATRSACLAGLTRRPGTIEDHDDLLSHVRECAATLAAHGADGYVPGPNALPNALHALSEYSVRRITAIGKLGHFFRAKKEIAITRLDCSPEQLQDVILHEVAHLLDYYLFAKRGHGSSWMLCAVTLGCKPSAYTKDERFKVAVQELRAERGKVVAQCRKCGYEVVKMRRSNRDWSRFRHTRCGGKFMGVQ